MLSHAPRRAGALLSAALLVLATPAAAQQPAPETLSSQVEIRRTEYGVPHIKAQNLRAAYYALGYVQLEDHGPRVAMGLLRARGEYGRFFGRDSADGDFNAQLDYRISVNNYPLLDADTRSAYEGFAAGVNRFIAAHPSEFPEGFAPHFTGYDVAARDVATASPGQARRFLAQFQREERSGGPGGGMSEGDAPAAAPTAASADAPAGVPVDAVFVGGADDVFAHEIDAIEEGSNAWAFHPSRTKSGKAVLLRNPHLSWTAGYYEAHMTVPGVVDFYGDFRIGGPFGVIGGFNKDLGWSTTNNHPDNDEIYALEVDPDRANHYLFDGASVPLDRELVTITYRNGPGYGTETREVWRSALGPVIHRGDGMIHVLKAGGDGDYRAGQQFLRMMRATSLAEWKEAMRMRARTTSNFTYADRAGNIFYVWNGVVPALPHPSGGDSAAVPARRMADVFTTLIPWDSLPQLLNPRGGYVHNENDSPWFANLRQRLDPADYPPNMEPVTLRLRSQLALDLIDNDRKYSLEEIMDLKNSYRMLLADRVKPDLVAAVRATNPTGDVASALALIEQWDNRAAHDSRGAMLFQTWWQRYTDDADEDTLFAQPWDAGRPTSTPRGLSQPAHAAEAFAWAIGEVVRRHGSVDVPWGDVHRVRHGDVDVPVGGCGGAMGCFRVLNFRTDPDGKRRVIGGDGWVIGVEFGDVPKSYSVLAYGQSPDPSNPHHDDQAAMFAAGEYKRVLFTDRDVEAGVERRYRP